MRGADAAGALAMVEAWTGPLSVATLVQLATRYIPGACFEASIPRWLISVAVCRQR